MSELLHLVEHRVQEVALLVMAIVYTVRLVWLFQFRAGRDRQPATATWADPARQGQMYSLATIVMPWAMESTRRRPVFYAQFVVFHLGVVANIALSFVIPYAPGLLAHAALVRALQVVIAGACLVGCVRMVRRLRDRVLRVVSTPDDYFSLALLIVWFALGVAAAPNDASAGEGHLVAYFVLTAFFLLYVPFSKISHYLYYPFTRLWLGRSLGHRGVFPLASGRRPS